MKDVPEADRIHHDLGQLFERRIKRYDLALEAYTQNLRRFKKGSRDYANCLGLIARMHLKLGDKEKAADFYRKAISCDVSETEHQQYQRGLFKTTDGKEGVPKVDIATDEPVKDLKAMRLKAESLLHRKQDYSRAAELYEQILEKAPTDVESMFRLGEVYEGLGKTEEATVLFEKVAFDNDIRVWVRADSYYGADSNLEGIYRQNKDIKKQIKLFTLTSRGNFSEIKGRLKSREDFEKFHKYLLEQFEQTPKNLKIRFYLVHHYFEGKETSKASNILEQLKIELTDEQGNIENTRHAVQLAKGFEKLGRFEEALAVLPTTDYENNPDRNDWMGELLMRLYAKVGQFDKTLEICRLRLKKDPRKHKIIKIAEQLAQATRYHVDGYNLLNPFLEDIKDKMSLRHYRRFCGAVKAYLAAHPADQVSRTNSTDIITLLKEGHRVQIPKDCRSFADFLEQLADQADTIATQSFMGRYGQRRKPPRLARENGSAFEVLAEAIDGTNIPFELTQEGYWAFFESGDKSKRISYGAAGGIFCRLWQISRSAEREHLYLGGRILFAPEVKRNIATIQSMFTVVEAIDNRGRNVPIPEVPSRCGSSTQIAIHLGKQQPPAKSIKKLRVKTAVAIVSKWVTFKIDRLDHSEPIVVEKDGVRIQIEPIKVIKRGIKQCWQIPIDIRRENIKLDAEEITELKNEVYFVTKDGERRQFGSSGSFPSVNHAKIAPHLEIDAFDPATTSLFIREPAAIEIVPFELTFRNIPIIDR